MICYFEGTWSLILAGLSGFVLYKFLKISFTLLLGFSMSTLAKNVPHVVYYQKQDFWAIFVRKHPLVPALAYYENWL